jgi:Spy/CpxP family protein refolding chaperone
MKFNRTLAVLAVAAATVGAGAVAATTTTTNTTPAAAAATAPAPGMKHWGHHHGGMMVGMMLHATRQLDLTAEQQTTIKGIMSGARAQHQAGGAAETDMSVLSNPGDPNYASATQAAKSRLEARFQQQLELQGQIYNVLTPAQKAKLPEVLGAMKAQAQQRRSQWLQQHSGTN